MKILGVKIADEGIISFYEFKVKEALRTRRYYGKRFSSTNDLFLWREDNKMITSKHTKDQLLNYIRVLEIKDRFKDAGL